MGNKIKKLFNKKSLEDLLYGLQSIPQARINNPAGIMLKDNELDEKTKQEMLDEFRVANDLGLTLPVLSTGAVVPAPMIGIGDSMLGTYIKEKQNTKNDKNKNTQFKCGGMKRVPRKKAFWGALVTAIAGLGAGVAKTIMNSNEQKKQMQFELDKQKLLADEQNAAKQTQADTEFYNNINANSGVYSDLHKGLKAKYGKRVRCKKSNGGFEWTEDDTGNIISSLLNIGTDLSTTTIQNNMNDNIRQTMLVTGQIGPNHTSINPNFNNLRNNNQITQPIDETAAKYNANLQNRKSKRLNSWYLS